MYVCIQVGSPMASPHTYIHMHIYAYISSCTYTYVHVYVCMHIYTYTYVYMYIHVYTYTFAYIYSRWALRRWVIATLPKIVSSGQNSAVGPPYTRPLDEQLDHDVIAMLRDLLSDEVSQVRELALRMLVKLGATFQTNRSAQLTENRALSTEYRTMLREFLILWTENRALLTEFRARSMKDGAFVITYRASQR